MFHEDQTDARSNRRLRRALVGLGAAVLVVSAVAASASAKEIGSGTGGGGGGTSTCNPVTSLSVKSDPRVGELGIADIQASYSVKPCTNGQVVTVETSVREYLDPTVVVYDNPAAPLSGKFVVNGVKVRVTYKVTVDVYDAATGSLAGTLSAFTAAIPKGV